MPSPTEDIELLKQAGGNEWIRRPYHRIYFNDLPKLWGLSCTYYNTGNISSATFRNKRISNARARKIYNAFFDAKLWWDVPSGTWDSHNLETEEMEYLVARIHERIEQLRTDQT